MGLSREQFREALNTIADMLPEDMDSDLPLKLEVRFVQTGEAQAVDWWRIVSPRGEVVEDLRRLPPSYAQFPDFPPSPISIDQMERMAKDLDEGKPVKAGCYVAQIDPKPDAIVES